MRHTSRKVLFRSPLKVDEFTRRLSSYVGPPTKFYKLRYTDKQYEGIVEHNRFHLVAVWGSASISGEMREESGRTVGTINIDLDKITSALAVALTVGFSLLAIFGFLGVWVVSGIVPHPLKSLLIFSLPILPYVIGRLRLQREVNRNISFFEKQLLIIEYHDPRSF